MAIDREAVFVQQRAWARAVESEQSHAQVLGLFAWVGNRGGDVRVLELARTTVGGYGAAISKLLNSGLQTSCFRGIARTRHSQHAQDPFRVSCSGPFCSTSSGASLRGITNGTGCYAGSRSQSVPGLAASRLLLLHGCKVHREATTAITGGSRGRRTHHNFLSW